jgi:hypothetical protein
MDSPQFIHTLYDRAYIGTGKKWGVRRTSAFKPHSPGDYLDLLVVEVAAGALAVTAVFAAATVMLVAMF